MSKHTYTGQFSAARRRAMVVAAAAALTPLTLRRALAQGARSLVDGVQVSFEQIARWDPDVIVTIDPHFYDEARTSALWRGMRAVKNGRVYLAPNVPYGWIDFLPSVNRLIGLRWLARVLYPELFPEDLRPVVREFYTLFYHHTPSEQQLAELLSGGESRRR